MQYRDFDAFLILYSISSRTSFNKVKVFRDEMLAARTPAPKPRRAGNKRDKPMSEAEQQMRTAVPTILVGNKNDLENKREVSFQEGEALARELGIVFMESTATDREVIMKPIEELVRQLRKWSDDIKELQAREVADKLKNSSRLTRLLSVFKEFLKKVKGKSSSAGDTEAPRRRRSRRRTLKS
ncbi:hypothetical protein G7Z17_g12720 [Cylindrodendrum hubeiense]|uniref:Uncharacterized protein n=1 Tax=Cylindrodendrum hubeiense TaxID=595255 RepID=A0A9P5GTH7_9HYPO|nr:hypothetical protein G7Z17_g12720 [Cylindrodendrum hubeiense]